jgi:hypothetical protein
MRFLRNKKNSANTSKIAGTICGYRVEEIEDKLLQTIRYLDKLIDEIKSRLFSQN